MVVCADECSRRSSNPDQGAMTAASGFLQLSLIGIPHSRGRDGTQSSRTARCARVRRLISYLQRRVDDDVEGGDFAGGSAESSYGVRQNSVYGIGVMVPNKPSVSSLGPAVK